MSIKPNHQGPHSKIINYNNDISTSGRQKTDSSYDLEYIPIEKSICTYNEMGIDVLGGNYLNSNKITAINENNYQTRQNDIIEEINM
jgi:hypothetical protein